MYCSREYQASTRLIQQYEKSTLNINILSLEALKNMYEIAATNLKMAREKNDSPKDHKPIHLQPGDMVLVQNHTK